MQLINAITTTNKAEIATIIRFYKVHGGAINFPALFNIPSDNRVAEMAKKDFRTINMVVIAAITMALESINLKRGMNEMQVLDLSELIIDSCQEENMALEDIVLFLQKVTKGEYEMSYESLDVPKMMKLFSQYREERIWAIEDYRINRHLEFKGIGPAVTGVKPSPLDKHLSDFSTKLQTMKDELKEKEAELKRAKQQK